EVVLGSPSNCTGTRPVARLRRGDVIGELALLTSEPRSATVVARLPTTVLELKQAAFFTLLERYPIVLGNLVHILGHRLVQRNAFDRQGHRGEAVAVIAGRSATALAWQVVTATQAASPHPVWMCAIGLPAAPEFDHEALSVAELCCRLDALLLAHRGVLVSIGLEHDELPMLLGEMDRVLLLGDAADAKRLAARLKATDPRVEVAVVGAEAGGAGPPTIAGVPGGPAVRAGPPLG